MSRTALAERLQAKGTRRIAAVDAPPGLDADLGQADRRADVADADVVVAFFPNRSTLEARLPTLLGRTRPEAVLWLAYPKLSSRLAQDLGRDIVHALAPAYGLHTVAAIAIDADWTALRVKRV